MSEVMPFPGKYDIFYVPRDRKKCFRVRKSRQNFCV